MTSKLNYTSTDSSGEETIMRYDTPLCGPKSWKENRDDESYNEELAEIFGIRDGEIQEAFGRIDDSSEYLFKSIDYGVIDYDLTITIPNIGPGKPKEGISNSYIFDKNDKENIKYASCGNLVRSVAEAYEEDKCAICNEGFCQEIAGEKWSGLTKWKRAHSVCWKILCIEYHKALEEENLNNTLLNWILYLSNCDLI